MAKKYTTKTIALLAILTALTFVLGRFIEIPIPAVNGYVTLLDAGIFTVSLAFGKKEGAVVGGLAAFLTDLTSGFPQWMLFSLVIHGLQGYFGAFTKSRALNWFISGAIMVCGYFLASWFLYGFATAINPLTNIPNLIQTTIGYLVGLMISQILQRAGVLNGL
ncbi:ECF transporter S component [Lactovum miscens]|uniref:Putative membrane protein n=1 Tax=Lactovum miscens TaxID=190387 RepID=A0A841CAV1_9LACT|nr:ECF transporter S component [Lactovum miscens]MBB5888519.1 putative membrane protein [Lactovum miscens]